MPLRTKAAVAVLLAALLAASAAKAADPGVARMPLRDFASYAETLAGLSPRINPDRLPDTIITLVSDREFSRPEWQALHDAVLGLLARRDANATAGATAEADDLPLLAVCVSPAVPLADALASVRLVLSDNAAAVAAPRAGCLVLQDDGQRLDDALTVLKTGLVPTHNP